MDPGDVRQFEAIAGSFLDDLGYVRASPAPSRGRASEPFGHERPIAPRGRSGSARPRRSAAFRSAHDTASDH